MPGYRFVNLVCCTEVVPVYLTLPCIILRTYKRQHVNRCSSLAFCLFFSLVAIKTRNTNNTNHAQKRKRDGGREADQPRALGYRGTGGLRQTEASELPSNSKLCAILIFVCMICMTFAGTCLCLTLVFGCLCCAFRVRCIGSRCDIAVLRPNVWYHNIVVHVILSFFTFQMISSSCSTISSTSQQHTRHRWRHADVQAHVQAVVDINYSCSVMSQNRVYRAVQAAAAVFITEYEWILPLTRGRNPFGSDSLRIGKWDMTRACRTWLSLEYQTYECDTWRVLSFFLLCTKPCVFRVLSLFTFWHLQQ